MKLLSINGMALITVLIFLEIFAMLSLYVLQNNFLQSHMLKNNWEKYQLRQAAAEQLSKAGAQLNLQLPACVVAATADLVNQPVSFWQTNACVGNAGRFQYYYVIEILGNDPCVVLDGSRLTAEFYRISLMVSDTTFSGGRVIMQGTLVKPNGLKVRCDGLIHHVQSGWQQRIELV